MKTGKTHPVAIFIIVGFAAVIMLCLALACVGAFTDADSDDDDRIKAPKSVPSQVTTKKVPDRGASPTVGKTSAKPRKVAPRITKKATPTPTKTRTTSTPVKTYTNCTELRRDYPSGVPAGHRAYRNGLDRDNDGYACEPS